MRRKLALLLAVVMILSLVPMSAFAASTYTQTSVETYAKGSLVSGLANRIQLKVDENLILENTTSTLFLELPAGVTADVYAKSASSNVTVNSFDKLDTVGRRFKAEVEVKETPSEDAILTIDVKDLKIPTNYSQDQVKLTLETSSRSVFSNISVPVANVAKGEVTMAVQEKRLISDSHSENTIGAVRFTENRAGAATKPVKLKLPRGFYWDDAKTSVVVTIRYGGTSTSEAVTVAYEDNVDNIRGQYRTAKIDVPASLIATESSSWEINEDQLAIKVDPVRAAKGDIEVEVTEASPKKVVIATFGGYEAEVKALTTPTIFAGQVSKLGKFEINESIAGSLAARRTITLELPVGAKWALDEDDIKKLESAPKLDGEDSNYNGLEFLNNNDDIAWQIVDVERRIIRATIKEESQWKDSDREGAKLVFKDAKVIVSPEFRGDIEVEVSGTAGAKGTVKLAEVKPAVTATINTVNNVRIGYQNQAIADITITETAAGAAERTAINTGIIALSVPAVRGTVFATTPKAEVVEGDMIIERVWMSTDRQSINIQVQGESDEASSIKVSNLALTMDRTAPEGKLDLHLTGDAIINNAVSRSHNFYGANVLDTLTVANVVSSAAGTEVNKEVVLTIGSTTMYVDGVAETANAAPYIDAANRTMLPLKAIGAVLGADVDWNETTRTVLVTKGTNRVLLTIDSDVMNVNGMQIPMRSKAVINNSRTFVPLKDLGVALGVSVEWDVATQSVTVK